MKFSWHDTLKPPTSIVKTDQTVLTRDNTPLSIYDCSFPLPFMAVSVSKVARMPRGEEAANSSSAGTLNLS